jgi:hypothetical protein
VIRVDRRYLIGLMASIGFFFFLAGFITTTLQVFPYSFLREAFLGLHRVDADAALADSDMYVLSKPGKSGVTRYVAGRAYEGYTLFASASAPHAYLVDMAGRVVHEWDLPYSRIWNPRSAVADPVAPGLIFWRRVWLFPNGDLLAVYEAWSDHPFGYGLVKVDRNSRPLWSFLERVHHDVEVGPDGNVYALSHRLSDQPAPNLPSYAAGSHYEDFANVISPNGVLLRQVSMLGALGNSAYARLIGLQRTSFDPLHSNDVTPVSVAWARRLGSTGANNVLVSFRNLDSLALVDLDSVRIPWLVRGPFARQHCSQVLPNGNITVFDNLGDTVRGGGSRVLEFQPSPFRLQWEFPGSSGEHLESAILGCAQRLPNGNTLITEGEGARILEVTHDDKVVWEYLSPFRAGSKKEFTPVLFSGLRYAPQDLHFTFNRETNPGLQTASMSRQ